MGKTHVSCWELLSFYEVLQSNQEAKDERDGIDINEFVCVRQEIKTKFMQGCSSQIV